MAFSRHDVSLVHISRRVGSMQTVHHGTLLGSQTVAVVGAIVLTHPYHEGHIAQVQLRSLTGMTCHHRGRGPPVGHTRSHTPHAVTACRIAKQINLVGADTHLRHRGSNELLEESVHLRSEPHVPVVERSARSHIHSLLGSVQNNLVAPLLVIHRRRRTASPMHRYIQTAPVGRLLSEHFIHYRHAQRVEREHL